MSIEHNGIHNPNNQIEAAVRTVSEFHDGKKALVAAGVGIALFGINFVLPRALNKAVDSIDAKGTYANGMYFPNTDPESDASFKCNYKGGDVIRTENITYEDELGEMPAVVFEQDNYGPQDGACADGRLTRADGEFWNSKVSEWGLAGLIFK